MKCCSKCGNEKLIEGVKYCLNCGADLEKNVKCCAKENDNIVNNSVNANDKLIEKIKYCMTCGTDLDENLKSLSKEASSDSKHVTRTRLSVELFEIF